MPLISELVCRDFRNFEKRNFNFECADVVFHGPNGSGKSNVLEAIGYLSTLRSFRRAPVRDMIRIGSNDFEISCKLELKRRAFSIAVRENSTNRRELFHAGFPCSKVSDFVFSYRCVSFSPADFYIGSGPAGTRRKFFDQMISSVDSSCMRLLSQYVRALNQRNRAAKIKNTPAMKAFESVMAENAPAIVAMREDMIKRVEREIRTLLNGKYDFAIRYKPDCTGNQEDFMRRFSLMRSRELARGCSLCGVQLDEIDFLLNGKSLRTFGSTGQIRLITLLARLAEFTILRRSPEPVAILADDVTGELDDSNKELFFKMISTADMRFHTYANQIKESHLINAQFIRI